MGNKLISIKRPLLGQSSSVGAQQQTHLTLVLSDIQNLAVNVNRVIQSNTIPVNRVETSWSIYSLPRGVCAFAIFISMAMTIGVITVCVTSPKPTNETCQLTFKRTAQQTINYDSYPHCVAVRDLNQDDHLDIVVADSGIDSIGILLSYGNGTFATQILYPTGLDSHPYTVAVADFNNDTLLDIVVANYGIHSIGVFLGYGNGSFGSQIITSLGSSQPLALVVEDFNNDTRLDIAVANYGTLTVAILLGSNDGSFLIDTIYDMGYDSFPYSITAVDFNQDKTLDLAIVNYGTSELVIILRNENTSFETHKYSTGNGSHPCSVATGDFNNDDILDVAVANSDKSNVGLFLGNGNGTFTNQMTHSTGSSSRPQFIVVNDFDGDTLLDITLVDSRKNNILVLKGNGNGSFSIITTHSTGDYSDPRSIAVGHFDNDSKPDIVIANSGTNNVLVLTSLDTYPKTTQAEYSTEGNSIPYSIDIADFNNDNYLDIAVAYSDSANVGIFINFRNGTFRNQETYYMGDTSYPFSVVAGDLNNDNHIDIVVLLVDLNQIDILLGNGDGTFRNGSRYSTGDGSGPYAIVVGHFNNDSNLDMITSNYQNGTVGFFFGYGDGTFTNMTSLLLEIEFYPQCLGVGDFNNDTILDIAVSDGHRRGIAILLGYGNGSFRNPILMSIDNHLPNDLTIGDLNNDHRLDIVYTDSLFSHVVVLLGNGNGTFNTSDIYATARASLPSCVALGYYNDDALLDIAVNNPYDSSISIYLGIGNGLFGTTYRPSTGYKSQPWSLAFADFDNNNQQEIVVANGIINNVLIFSVHYDTNFANEASYITGASPHPYAVSVGDLNNDGQSDIAVAHSGNDEIVLLVGYKNGIFMNKTFFSTGPGSHPQSVTIADFNKDHLLDIAVVNLWSSDMHVFIGLGNGSFDTPSIYSTGFESFPNSIAAGDFNKDGRVDVVIANQNTSNVAVFLAFDYVIFTKRVIYVPGLLPTPIYVVTDDFNNDGELDIAVVNSGSNEFGIYLGYGNGTFSEQISYATGSSSWPRALAAGDFNNDNYIDIVVANSHTNNIGVFLGYGNGSFQPQILYSTGNSSEPRSLAIGDFNNDSRLDIVVANYYSDNIWVFLGDGSGSFTGQVVYSMINTSYPLSVTVADLNNDRILDIVVANYYVDHVCILVGYGDGSFRNVIILSTGLNSGPYSIAIGDLNKDKALDIAVANQKSEQIGLFYGYGNGTFSSQKTYSTGSHSGLYSIVVSDINNDTILDILVSDYNTANSSIGIFYGFGNGNFTLPEIFPTGMNAIPNSIASGDFNNDRRVDLAISYYNQDSIGVMLQLKSEPFASSTLLLTGDHSYPKSVAVGDFNNDAQLDIAVANTGTNNIGIFLGDGNGYFDNQMIYSIGNSSLSPEIGPSSLALGDFNSDHHLDIAVVNTLSRNIAILFGCGNGTFANVTIYSTGIGSDPSSIAAGDLNDDNHVDLVVANWGTNNVLVFFGKGDGSFFEPKPYSVGYNARPQAVAIGDINNDNLLDIVLANYGTDYVEILVQSC